jgi:hypothetical protein
MPGNWQAFAGHFAGHLLGVLPGILPGICSAFDSPVRSSCHSTERWQDGKMAWFNPG